MKHKKHTLKNGLRVITVPIKDNPAVTVLVAVGVGSDYETEKQNGLSHFLEHMCFKGTAKRPSAFHISKELDSIGAQNNAFTSNEYTGYYAKAHPKHLEKIFDVVSDIYLNPTFPEKELEKEKGVIVQELRMYKDMPQRHVIEMFYELLYKDQPAGRNIVGTEKNVTGFKRDDFARYHDTYYRANNTVVVIAGQIDERKALALVRKTFERAENKKIPAKPKVIEKQKKPEILYKSKKTDQIHLMLGCHAYSIKHKDSAVLEVLSTVLGRGMSSRLFQKMREELGICYYVKAVNAAYSDHGYLAVHAGVDKARVGVAVKAIMDEFKRLRDELVPDDELQKAKDLLAGNMYLSLEASDELAFLYAEQDLIADSVKNPRELEKKIRAVTANDIRRVAKAIFLDKKLNLALLGGQSAPKGIKELLHF